MHPLLVPDHGDLSPFAELPSSEVKRPGNSRSGASGAAVGFFLNGICRSWRLVDCKGLLIAKTPRFMWFGPCGSEVHAEPHG